MKLSVKLKMYKYEANIQQSDNWPEKLAGYSLNIWKPGVLSLKHKGTSSIVNLIWYILTFGKFRIIFLKDQNKIVHYTYITPKTMRFPFMERNDLMIGPCFTYTEYRGKGIFIEVLKKIINCEGSHSLWICANLNNVASLKAFEKAGFSFHSFAQISRATKKVKLLTYSK
jgi:hypothetical protein